MPIRSANLTDIEQVRRLLNNGRRVYLNLGYEDLAALLQEHPVFMGEEDGRPWGFVGFWVEERPASLPDNAPTRVNLQALALAAGYKPQPAGSELLRTAIQNLCSPDEPRLVIVHGAEHWLQAILPALGFTLADQIRFFRLELRPGTRPVETHHAVVATLHPMTLTDLSAVAALDAATFEPLWHYGAKDLWPLLFNGRATIALLGREVVGYSALATIGNEAHLTRLAVHPSVQGRGVGRQLMTDVLTYARNEHLRAITLNTQISNVRSQQLYRQFGFQTTRQLSTVFTLLCKDQYEDAV